MGIYKAGQAGRGLVDGKLLRQSIRSKGDSCLLHPTEFLLKTGHSDKILRVGGEEFNQISRMVKCQEWGFSLAYLGFLLNLNSINTGGKPKVRLNSTEGSEEPEER